MMMFPQEHAAPQFPTLLFLIGIQSFHYWDQQDKFAHYKTAQRG